jgi:molecular chaperone HtpG
MTKKGTISVNTTDIFPIIKKWLYSEHDIFFRELVSNACDAITKRHTIARTEGQKAPEGQVKVSINKEAKTIQFIDNGIGMTESEVEKYIAQLAFSGAEEFVTKMKDMGPEAKDEIIGKFGLGFYSSFMVAKKVEVESLSHVPGSLATKWICDGDTEYTFESSEKADVGTTITLHINEENTEFLDSWKTRQVLTNYCDFMPFPIELEDFNEKTRIEAENAKAEKEEDKKPLPLDIINETQPLWKKDPSSLNDDDYKSFYRKMFPMDGDPLFWIHLNIDHPFTLQGILFFPKLNRNQPVNQHNIRLYSKQVFVSDNVKNVIPDFLSMLKGAIDSTDIPLNVSRSALQGDPNIKKISNYIIKKVSESLKKLYKSDRTRYEQVWDDISLFVKYGCVSDEKFDEKTREFVLFKNTDGKMMTLSEYKEALPSDFKEKLENQVIYFEEGSSSPSIRKQLLEKEIPVITTDTYIDPHFMQHTEMKKVKDEEYKFTVVDNALELVFDSENVSEDDIKIRDIFSEVLTPDKNDNDPSAMEIEVKNMGGSTSAAYFKIDESMKRMQRMTQSMGQDASAFPIKKTLVLNPSNPLIKNAFKLWSKEDKKELAKKLCFYVQDLATISGEGLKEDEKEGFISRSQDLMSELSNLAL